MPRSVFAAGQDAMLGFLAERDAVKRLNEDRARRDRLDAEEAADRARGRDIQEENLRNQREDRAERLAETKRINNERIAASEAKRKQDEAVQGLVKEMLDPNTPQERKQAIGFELDRLQVSPSLIDKYLNPKATTKPVFGVDPHAGTVRQFGEVPVDAQVVNIPRPAGAGGPKPPKDDPRLPMGTKRWIESISQRGVPLEEARTELSRGWGQQTSAHPNADLGEAAAFLQKLYPTDSMGQRSPMGGGAPVGEAAAPAPAPINDEMRSTAHAIISNQLGKDATPQQVERFLSDPNNVAEIQKMLGGR